MSRVGTILWLAITDDSDDEAFDAKRIRRFDRNRFHCVIGRTQLDRGAFAVIGFDRGVIVDDGNHRLAVPGRVLFLDDDEIAGKNAFVPHRLSLDPQGKRFAAPLHAGRDFNEFGLRNRFDGVTRRHQSREWNVRRSREVIDGQSDGKGDLMGADFVARDGLASGFQPLGQLFLSEPKGLTCGFEIYGMHVTNRYIAERACQGEVIRPAGMLRWFGYASF